MTKADKAVPANSFMVQPGAGVVVPLNPEWGVVGQVDYQSAFANQPINAVRVVLGIRVNRK